MKIAVLSDNQILIFINYNYLSNVDFKSKDSIILAVKNYIIKYKSKLKLQGFYKVKVYVSDNVGLFLELIKLDDSDYINALDLRVIVNLDDKVFFKTESYDILPSNINVYYLDNYFYCDVSLIPNLLDVVEFGVFVYGSDINNIFNNAFIINNKTKKED